MRTDQRIRTAKHEAAHAVAALDRGFTISRVVLNLGGDGFCEVETRPSVTDFDKMVLCMAGRCADCSGYRLPDHFPGDDGAKICQLFRERIGYVPYDMHKDPILQQALAYTAELIGRNWTAIDHLANRLLNEKEILGADVVLTIREFQRGAV